MPWRRLRVMVTPRTSPTSPRPNGTTRQARTPPPCPHHHKHVRHRDLGDFLLLSSATNSDTIGSLYNAQTTHHAPSLPSTKYLINSTNSQWVVFESSSVSQVIAHTISPQTTPTYAVVGTERERARRFLSLSKNHHYPTNSRPKNKSAHAIATS